MNGWSCVCRMGGLGDNLIVSSVFPCLRAKYGKLEVISKAPNAVVFENNPHIDRLTVWPEKEQITDPVANNRRIGFRMEEYDFGVHLSHTCEVFLALFEAQSQFWWPPPARRLLCDRSYLGLIHDICGIAHDYAPRFYPTDQEWVDAEDIYRRMREKRDASVIGWCISGSRLDKAYPGSHAAIAQLLQLGYNVQMIGKPGKEFLMAKEIEQAVIRHNGPDERGSAAGLWLTMTASPEKPDWPIRRSLAQTMKCDAVVGPDTGPMWAVAALAMPKVMLLSHASPKNITHGWTKTTTLHAEQERVACWPCHRLHDTWETCSKAAGVEAAACIADIPVAAIINAVTTAIGVK